MGIKWEDVRILNSPLTNNIVLGKGKTDGGLFIATDRSKDKTDEILSAVMCYMDQWATDNKCKGMQITYSKGLLTWKKAEEAK